MNEFVLFSEQEPPVGVEILVATINAAKSTDDSQFKYHLVKRVATGWFVDRYNNPLLWWGHAWMIPYIPQDLEWVSVNNEYRRGLLEKDILRVQEEINDLQNDLAEYQQKFGELK